MKSQQTAKRGERGFILLYVIIAIVLVSIVGAAVMSISSSATMSEVELTQLNNARYLSESGVLYAKGLVATYENQSKGIDAAVTALNNNSGKTTIAGVGSFVLTATKSGTNSIRVTSIGLAQSGMAKYKQPSSTSITYTAASNASTNDALQGIYSGIAAYISGTFSGNFATVSPTLNGGTVVNGSLNYLNTTSTCLDVTGGVTIGVAGNDDYLCSDSCLVIEGGSVINGNIYAQGNVTVTATVNGNIYSGGNVALGWGAKVNGDIYTHGTFTQPANYTDFKGTVHYNSPVPSLCTSYTLPAHETVASSTALKIDWSGSNTSTYTFFGKSDLSDHSNAYSSIYSAGGTKICFDLSTPGTHINIFDSGDMTINGDIYIRTSTTTSCFDSVNQMTSVNFANYAAASRVYMDVLGAVTFGGGSEWFGTVYAKGNVYPGGTAYIGAFYTNAIFNPNNQGGVTARFVASDYVSKYWP
jgi:hypothetical protein